MSSPPTLDAGTVHDEDGLSDGEGAVVPDYQEHEQEVHHPVIEEVVGGGQDTTLRHKTSSSSLSYNVHTNQVDYQLELLVGFLVLIFLVLVQYAAVHIADDSPQIPPTLPGEDLLHLFQLSCSSEDVLVEVLHLALLLLGVALHLPHQPPNHPQPVLLVGHTAQHFLLEGQTLVQGLAGNSRSVAGRGGERGAQTYISIILVDQLQLLVLIRQLGPVLDTDLQHSDYEDYQHHQHQHHHLQLILHLAINRAVG